MGTRPRGLEPASAATPAERAAGVAAILFALGLTVGCGSDLPAGAAATAPEEGEDEAPLVDACAEVDAPEALCTPVAALPDATLSLCPAMLGGLCRSITDGTAASESGRLVGYVDPMIGTFPAGFTHPGAVRPRGMVALGPDTEGPFNYGGYLANNLFITGFSHVHMSAGVPQGGQFPVMPVVGPVLDGDLSDSGWPEPFPHYASPFDKLTEVARPGYYAVTLLRYGVRAEMAATERAGLHRYAFPAVGPSQLVLHAGRDIKGRGPARVWLDEDGWLNGSMDVRSPDYTVHFAARLDRDFSLRSLDGAALTADEVLEGEGIGVVLEFDGAGDAVLLKVGISYVDSDGARRNAEHEIPHWDFERVVSGGVDAWEAALRRIEVEGGTAADRVRFYTALYRAQKFPNLISDVDGRYRGPDDAVHISARPRYTQFSLWDSYRGQNQLLAEIDPEAYVDMVDSQLDFYRQAGTLPRWQLAYRNPGYMSGDPAVFFVGEALCRGLLPEREHELFDAMRDTAEQRADQIVQGFVPVSRVDNVSAQLSQGDRGAGTTLEFGLADFTLALVADRLGNAVEAERLRGRSLNYRNLQDPDSGWIRPRHEDGAWLEPFFPSSPYGFQEGTSWQYSWLAMHDLRGLYDGMGGDGTVERRLDTFFGWPLSLLPLAWPTVQEYITLFGVVYVGNQFAPGNQHDLQAPWLYHYLGKPWKSAAVASSAASLHTPTIAGLPGNDDLGSLSGWLVWNMLGIYPMNPGTPLFVIGSPVFERAVLRRPGGDLQIEAPGSSPLAGYVRDAAIDGEPLARSWFVMPRDSATLQLDVGALPRMAWGRDPEQRPPSISTHPLADFGCRR